MIKKILATVVLFTVLISSNATASRFENVKIGSILPHIGGVIFFNIKDVSLDNVQGAGSCATASAGYYRIDIEETINGVRSSIPEGEAFYAALLLARGQDLPVNVQGTDTCNQNRENIRFITILN